VSSAGYFPAQALVNEILNTFSLALTYEADLNILEGAQRIAVLTANAKLGVMESSIRSPILELGLVLLSFTLAIIIAAIIITTSRTIAWTIVALFATMMSSIISAAIIFIMAWLLVLIVTVIITVIVIIAIFAIIITATARFARLLLGLVAMIIIIRRIFIAT